MRLQLGAPEHGVSTWRAGRGTIAGFERGTCNHDTGRRHRNLLPELINPPHPSKVSSVRSGITLRVGDHLIQQKNDYNREVFNGEKILWHQETTQLLGTLRAVSKIIGDESSRIAQECRKVTSLLHIT